MALINSLLSWLMKQRIHQIELFLKYPHEVQFDWFNALLGSAKGTEFGRKYDFKSIRSREEFMNRVPVHDYESMKPFIEKLLRGEQNIL